MAKKTPAKKQKTVAKKNPKKKAKAVRYYCAACESKGDPTVWKDHDPKACPRCGEDGDIFRDELFECNICEETCPEAEQDDAKVGDPCSMCAVDVKSGVRTPANAGAWKTRKPRKINWSPKVPVAKKK